MDETKPADPYALNQDTQDAVAALCKRRFDEFSKGRENFLPWAFRNILFYRGQQWILLDRNYSANGGWRQIRPRDPNTPLPVTNKFKRVINACHSMTARFNPALNFAPGSDSAEDRAAADLSSKGIEVVEDEVNITTHRQILSKWVWLTGGGWRETGYDNDMAHGSVDTLMNVCPAEGCGEMAPPTPMMPMQQGAPAVDEMGNMPDLGLNGMPQTPCPACQTPMVEQTVPMPKGRMYVEVRSVFEMFFDPSIADWTKQTDYVCQSAVDVDKAKTRWPKIADAIKADSMGAGYAFMEKLPTIGPGPGQGRWQTALGGRATNTKVTENWYYRLPDATYPQGLVVVMLGKTPTQYAYHGPLTTFFEEEDGARSYFLPHVFFPQDEVPGSGWPATVADDLADKQRERNQWEMMIRLAGMKMSNPVWLTPRGAAMSSPTGQSGQVIEFNPVPIGGGTAVPQRLDGRPITASWTQCIVRIDAEMNDLAAQADILRGERPTGVNTALQSQLLKERAESQFGPMFVKWNHAEAQWARQALAIFKQHATEARLRKIKGEDGAWEVQKFLGADLRGRVDVVPEAGIAMPHTTLSERAEAQEAIAMGLLNPLEPETRRALLKKWRLLDYLPNLSKDVRNASIENEQFRALAEALAQEPPTTAQSLRMFIQTATAQGVPPPVILAQVETKLAAFGLPIPKIKPDIDDHAVHAQEHKTDAKNQDFGARPEVLQVFEELHIAAHNFFVGQALQAQQQARVGMAGPPARNKRPGQPGPNPGSSPSTPAAVGPSGPNRMAGEEREMAQRMA